MRSTSKHCCRNSTIYIRIKKKGSCQLFIAALEKQSCRFVTRCTPAGRTSERREHFYTQKETSGQRSKRPVIYHLTTTHVMQPLLRHLRVNSFLVDLPSPFTTCLSLFFFSRRASLLRSVSFPAPPSLSSSDSVKYTNGQLPDT